MEVLKLTDFNNLSAAEAIEKLKKGNKLYLDSINGIGDISPAQRLKTAVEGQHPYAIIISCSDSRVIPESIFGAGIGELFVIRVAGNVMDDHQLGSVEYAASHLGVKLIVVLGHDHCGAVDAAINHDPEGYIKFITDEIKKAIGNETDGYKACCLNVMHAVERLKNEFANHPEIGRVTISGAIYDIHSGAVTWL